MKRKIKSSVTHRGIGGKEIKIDDRITKELTVRNVFDMGMDGNNWACLNFVNRRRDFDINFPHKLYYGKVEGLGYVVAEDELEEVENESND